jgi:hypothetical protein
MEQVAERVFFKEDREAEEETTKVFAVVNMVEEVEYLLRVFKLESDAIEYAMMEAELNELDEYVVVEKELL